MKELAFYVSLGRFNRLIWADMLGQTPDSDCLIAKTITNHCRMSETDAVVCFDVNIDFLLNCDYHFSDESSSFLNILATMYRCRRGR